MATERARPVTISPDNFIHKTFRKTVKIEPKLKSRYEGSKADHGLPTLD
jgi:hypothetical protein